MISYAQNFEDVMLWRALKDVENGFYIDIGAYHPEADSVTKWFYDQGWTGINIEPAKELIQEFHKSRPNDINLNVAISNRNGEADFHYLKNTGLSTLKKANIDLLANLELEMTSYKVSTTTLTDIINQCSNKDIQFLKIDAEGAEYEILQGYDFSVRPIIILIEATIPNSPEKNHLEWENILIENKYSMVYDDGLNRYYLRDESIALEGKFHHPPNVFDKFIVKKIETNLNYQLLDKVLYDKTIQKNTDELNDNLYQLLEKQKVQNRELITTIKELVSEQIKKLDNKNTLIDSLINEKYKALNQFETELKISRNTHDDLLKDYNILSKEHDILLHQNHLNIESREAIITKLKDENIAKQSEAENYKILYTAIKQSLSWKFTFPFRKTIDILYNLINFILKHLMWVLRRNKFIRKTTEKILIRSGKFGQIFLKIALKNPPPFENIGSTVGLNLNNRKLIRYQNVLDYIPEEKVQNFKLNQ